jgi:hypothetical protein
MPLPVAPSPVRLASALATLLLVGCSSTVAPSPSVSAVPSNNPTDLPNTTAAAASSVAGTTIPGCTETGTARAGVVDVRPDGWTLLSNGSGLAGFPDVYWKVYGPEGTTVPPTEGPSRLALYETFSTSDAYFKSRVNASHNAGGKAVAVTVCGVSTEAWTDAATGELVLGWTYRGKSDVLVANTADYTVQQLVESAEWVFDCCG